MYFVRAGTRWALVDAGRPTSARQIRDAARALRGQRSQAYRPPPRRYVRLQPIGFAMTALGLSPGYVAVLEVPVDERAPVVRANLLRGGRRPEMPQVIREARNVFGTPTPTPITWRPWPPGTRSSVSSAAGRAGEGTGTSGASDALTPTPGSSARPDEGVHR